MTPQERAEKIVTDMDCDSCQYTLEMRKQMTALIAAQIEEAEREAVKELMLTELSQKQVFKEGWNAARKKAKGIAESYMTWEKIHDVREITDRISKMEP